MGMERAHAACMWIFDREAVGEAWTWSIVQQHRVGRRLGLDLRSGGQVSAKGDLQRNAVHRPQLSGPQAWAKVLRGTGLCLIQQQSVKAWVTVSSLASGPGKPADVPRPGMSVLEQEISRVVRLWHIPIGRLSRCGSPPQAWTPIFWRHHFAFAEIRAPWGRALARPDLLATSASLRSSPTIYFVVITSQKDGPRKRGTTAGQTMTSRHKSQIARPSKELHSFLGATLIHHVWT